MDTDADKRESEDSSLRLDTVKTALFANEIIPPAKSISNAGSDCILNNHHHVISYHAIYSFKNALSHRNPKQFTTLKCTQISNEIHAYSTYVEVLKMTAL